MNAGENMVFMGGGIRAGGNASLSAGGDLLLLAYDTGKQVRVIPRDKDDNPNNDKGPTWAYENSTYNQTGVDSNVGGSFSDSAGGNLSAVGSIDIVGAQIDSQGFAASAGGNYSERAAYDIHERVSTSSTKMSGPGTYLLDFTNNMNWLATGGQAGGRTETYRGTNDVDSTRTAIVTNINAGSGEVKHNVAGETFIEGSIVKGGLISPERLGPRVTLAAAMDTRHVEHSVSTSTIRWQSTDSTGYIQQTLHMPEIHGTIPAGMSAYQGAGGVSVQLPAGSNVRSAIEQLSKEPGKEYLKELGNRSDIDWQRVDVLNKSLDFSKSGLTQEATIAVIIVVSILTYGAASSAGGAAATSAGMTTTATATGAGATTVAATGAGVAGTGVAAGTVLTTTGAAVASAVTAGLTSLASTAAVSLINNKGDIGAVLKELGSKENAQGLLLTMATAGLTQGVLDKAGLSGVSGASPIEYVLAKQAVQGLTSAVLESAVLGTNLEDAIKNNLKSALINTVAAKGAFTIGEGGKTGDLNAASKVIA
ncbi:MAG: DUF637 domain-containing protein, partial [Hydrogenophaga sp.]|nr:DUF637 domain-containing protein [Hydrogenophaga sp.]